MINPIRLMIVDDQKLMRQGLRTLLELEGGFEIVAEVGDGQAALDAYAELQPDVVLMDIRMPGMNGVEATRLIKKDKCNPLEHDAPKLTDFGDNIMLQNIDFDHVHDFGLIQSKIIVN